ncbi:unnamed protein product [Prunus brigantina]
MAAKPDMVAEDHVSVNILARPPAVSFASSAASACVGKTWNQSCNTILSRPQFSSALSLNPDLHAALDEVLADAFSKPLRPDFIVAYIGINFSLEETHHLITEKVGPGIPVITNKAKGLIGTDVQTDKLREVIWGSTDGDSEWNENNSNRGIVLSVGYMPGLKVDVIPLLRPKNEQQLTMVDHFLMEIMDFTCAASGSLSPSCIIMFGDKNEDMNPILTILDHVMPDETTIVGDASAAFLCTRMDEAENYNKDVFSFATAALVFARDQYRPEADIGETEFHVTVSNGIIPFGPHLKTVSVLEKHCLCSWVSAIMLGFESVIIDCYDVLMELKSQIKKPDMYIGVTQRRNYSILEKPPSSIRSLSFHEVKDGEGDFILVDGIGIKPGDIFFFYHADAENALITIDQARRKLRTLREDYEKNGREVFGGFIFSCENRGVSFFKRPGVDSKPFAMNFPGVPVAGMFGNGGEIGRGALLGVKKNLRRNGPRSCVHVYSSVYLAMSYVPPPEAPMIIDE